MKTRHFDGRPLISIFRKGAIRHAAGALLLLVVSTSTCLGAFELLLRWNVVPNTYYLENRVLGGPAQNGLFTFIIGDSFIAPSQPFVADYIYPVLAPHGVRIRNTATPGTGPVQYLDDLRREGARYRPDVVLLSYYVGNDMADVGCVNDLEERLRGTPSPPAWMRTYTMQYVREVLQRTFPGKVFFTPSSRPGVTVGGASLQPVERASIYSPLNGILRFGVRRPSTVSGTFLPSEEPPHAPDVQEVDYAKLREAGIPEEYIEAAKAGEINPWVVNFGAENPDYFRDQLLIRSECAQHAWENTKRALDLILEETAKLDADVFPVIFPNTLQVDTLHYSLYRAWKINVDDEMLVSDLPQQLLREYFLSRGIEPLDLLDAFRAEEEALYWERDEHMNVRGQQLSGELISEAFIARYLGDDRP